MDTYLGTRHLDSQPSLGTDQPQRFSLCNELKDEVKTVKSPITPLHCVASWVDVKLGTRHVGVT